MGWQAGLCVRWLGVADLPVVRLFPTHSGIQSCPKGEGWRPRSSPGLCAALRAAACGRALVSCLASAVHASRRNRRADFQPPHEATSMNAQSNHPINDTTDPQFLGPEAGQQAGGKAEGGSRAGRSSPRAGRHADDPAHRADTTRCDESGLPGVSQLQHRQSVAGRAATAGQGLAAGAHRQLQRMAREGPLREEGREGHQPVHAHQREAPRRQGRTRPTLPKWRGRAAPSACSCCARTGFH
jgi:hypothetical protein